MRSFLLSVLVRRYGGVELEAFRRTHPHDWLVWEPGVWRPALKTTTLIMQKLVLPTVPAPNADGEALAFALDTNADKPVTVGRAPTCDIPVNDATLSQIHLQLMHGPGGWTVRDAGSRNGSWLEAAPLTAGTPFALTSGAKLRTGQVMLTYYSPGGMFARIKEVRPPG